MLQQASDLLVVCAVVFTIWFVIYSPRINASYKFWRYQRDYSRTYTATASAKVRGDQIALQKYFDQAVRHGQIAGHKAAIGDWALQQSAARRRGDKVIADAQHQARVEELNRAIKVLADSFSAAQNDTRDARRKTRDARRKTQVLLYALQCIVDDVGGDYATVQRDALGYIRAFQRDANPVQGLLNALKNYANYNGGEYEDGGELARAALAYWGEAPTENDTSRNAFEQYDDALLAAAGGPL